MLGHVCRLPTETSPTDQICEGLILVLGSPQFPSVKAKVLEMITELSGNVPALAMVSAAESGPWEGPQRKSQAKGQEGSRWGRIGKWA